MKKIILMVLMLGFILINAEIVVEIEKINKTFTDESLFYKQLTFKGGDVIDRTDIEKSIANLKRMDLFGKIEFQVLKIDSGLYEIINIADLKKENIDDTVNVYITAKEMLFIYPSVVVNIDKENTVVQLGAKVSNLWRIRHIGEVLFSFGAVKGIDLIYHIPYLYSRPYQIYGKAYNINLDRKQLSLKQNHKGVLTKTGYTLSPNFQPEVILGYDRLVLSDSSLTHAFSNNFSGMYDEFVKIGARNQIDYRDDPYYPKKGFYNDIEFIHEFNNWNVPIKRNKFKFDIRNFFDIKYGVIAIKNKVYLQKGTLAYYDNKEGDFIENRGVPDSLLIGFNKYFANIEYRYDIPFLNYYLDAGPVGSFTIGTMLVLFLDYSYVNDSLNDFNPFKPTEYLYGFGAGIRLHSPFFNLLGVDIGYNPNYGVKYNFIILAWNF